MSHAIAIKRAEVVPEAAVIIAWDYLIKGKGLSIKLTFIFGLKLIE